MNANKVVCFICLNALTKRYGRKKIIHSHDKTNPNCEKWEHSCHEKCLNKWSKQCITTGEGVYPKCPVCNDFKLPINQIHISIRNRALELLEEEENELEEEEVFEEEVWEELVEEVVPLPKEVIEAGCRLHYIHIRRLPYVLMPFLGIMVCINGKLIKKYTNSNFGLTINHTIGELKHEIMRRNVEISQARGILNFQSLAHNLKLENWTNWRHPTFRVIDVHTGIPPYTCQFEHLDIVLDLNNNNNITLSEYCLEYQAQAGAIINSPELVNSRETPNAHEHLKDVYNKKNIVWHGPSGPDDPGSYETGFHNDENPHIVDEYLFDEGRRGRDITCDSLSWLVVNIENV